MLNARGFISFLLAGLAIMAGVHSPARATVTAPCLSAAVTTNFSPINGGTSTYCQTGFGWSDTWFPTAQPPSYDAHLDVLSGDNAPSLSYTVNGTPVGTGNFGNFLSPFLDGGNLNSQNIGGGATFGSDIPAGTLTGSGSSTVNVGQVQVGITTTVNPSNSVTEMFTFTNTSTTDAVTGADIRRLLQLPPGWQQRSNGSVLRCHYLQLNHWDGDDGWASRRRLQPGRGAWHDSRLSAPQHVGHRERRKRDLLPHPHNLHV